MQKFMPTHLLIYIYGVGTLFPALMKMSKHHIFKKKRQPLQAFNYKELA